MSKKIKKGKKLVQYNEATGIFEGTGESSDVRSGDVEFDEENGDLIIIHTFKHEWGDPIEGEFEHVYPMDEAVKLCADYLAFVAEFRNKQLVEKVLHFSPEQLPGKESWEQNPGKEYEKDAGFIGPVREFKESDKKVD